MVGCPSVLQQRERWQTHTVLRGAGDAIALGGAFRDRKGAQAPWTHFLVRGVQGERLGGRTLRMGIGLREEA